MSVTVRKFVNNGWRKDNHLNFTLWVKGVDGEFFWKDGIVEFVLFEKAEDQINHVMQWQTDFVRENWIRLEITVPNHNQYGSIDPGYIQETGVLIATQTLAGDRLNEN